MRTRIFFLLAVMMIVAAPISAQSGTVADIAAGNPNFSTLLAAADAAGLTGNLTGGGPVTVFAPTNGAFNTLLGNLGVTQDELLADTGLLRSVVSYHVASGQFAAGDVITAGGPVQIPTLNGASISASFNGSRIVLNGGAATVTQPNLFAGNGIVHVIDNVLLPPEAIPAPPAPDAPPVVSAESQRVTVYSIVANNPDFTVLTAALDATGLSADLSGTAEFTLLAPNDGAFGTLLNNLNFTRDGLLADTTLLRSVLTYHVIEGRRLSDQLYAIGSSALGPSINSGPPLPVGFSLQQIPTLNGAPLTLGVDGPTIVINNGAATVTNIDYPASNGVVHIIDNVLLP